MRVVLDTNVLISAFVFPGGAPEAVYRLALEGQVELVTSRALLAEFGRILEEKFGWQPELSEAAVAQLIRLSIVVEPTACASAIAVDPDNDRVLEAADAGEADVIVSGDHHLLDLASWHGVYIMRPAAFSAMFEKHEQSRR